VGWFARTSDNPCRAERPTLVQREADGLALQYQAALQEVQTPMPASLQPTAEALDRDVALIRSRTCARSRFDPAARTIAAYLRAPPRARAARGLHLISSPLSFHFECRYCFPENHHVPTAALIIAGLLTAPTCSAARSRPLPSTKPARSLHVGTSVSKTSKAASKCGHGTAMK
jgi:hypothetical protein